MREYAKEFFNKGYNCCECVIMAANKQYNLRIDKDSLKLGACLNKGLGVGSICGAILGGLMILGYIFERKYPPEHTELGHIKMKFIDGVDERLCALNCPRVTSNFAEKGGCAEVVSIIAEVLEIVIKENV